ncbi:Crp/Fnr family transcriptional regulator [Pseudorhodoferax sp. Leaf267]|uniref:Crp/Fnr family transcriptional regulator n=1 Tax=Pseudorhodoferax sp. Leaf267 TaxID=1736316 RepID=UPI0006FAC71E|nr:Crp/Fnr family transcriptional regulator [Pseudorhodoferax sp. Leaf267]KQP23649.1 Crp/Fnr family transcriptional regulator [Pseudorhodoferax sp. Leaf267]
MFTHNVLRNRSAELSEAERLLLESAISHTQTFRAGETVVRQGVPVDISTLLVQGLMTRHVDAHDGRRHLVAVHLPGDFVDLHAYALKQLDHEVGALSDITVAVFRHAELERIQLQDMQLTRRLWFLTLLDAAMHRQWICRLASLNALQRVAHFLCEMNARLLAIDASDGHSFALPMTQADIGEVCGLTNVHVNRVLRQLREMGLCQMRAAQVQIHDLPGLAATALFDPEYLYLNRRIAMRATAPSGVPHD